MLLLFLRHGAAESRTFMLGNCLNILNIHFITSPNFPKCKYLCMWTVMYHYRISVGQADIHRVCLKHLTHEAQEHCAVPWASSHSQGAHFPGSPKDTSGFSRMNLPVRLSATSPHARPEAHTVSTLQIPTLCGKAMGRHPAVRLCLPPCHPSSSFIWVSSKWHKRQSRMLPSL